MSAKGWKAGLEGYYGTDGGPLVGTPGEKFFTFFRGRKAMWMKTYRLTAVGRLSTVSLSRGSELPKAVKSWFRDSPPGLALGNCS